MNKQTFETNSSLSDTPHMSQQQNLSNTPTRFDNKVNRKWKNTIMFTEFIVIVVLVIAIIIVFILHIIDRRLSMDAIFRLETQQSSLTEEVMILSEHISELKELQAFTQGLGDTILTYDTFGNEVRIPILPSVKKHSYDWTNLQYKDGFFNYLQGDTVVSYRGIDVSSFQGEINWEQVKASGIDFAIIRLGYRGYGTGAILLDEYFERNIQGATAVGINVGIYFFSQAVTEAEAIEEANFVLQHINGYNISYPIIYDAEEITHDTARTDSLTVHQLTDHAIAFCNTIKIANYKTMIYGNKKWLVTKLDLTRLADYDFWLAYYVSQPEYPYDFKMWQYSDNGSVLGINGEVDLNISFHNYAQ